jgi:hypothetical protein
MSNCSLCKKPLNDGERVGVYSYVDKQGKAGHDIGHLLCIASAMKIVAEEEED